MANVSVNINVSKETYELGAGIARTVAAIRSQLGDGFQLGDVAAIIKVVTDDLIPAVEGYELVAAEMRENPDEFAMAIALSLSEIYGSLK